MALLIRLAFSRAGAIAATVIAVLALGIWAWDEAGDRRQAELEADRAVRHIDALNRLREIEEETRDATDDDLRRELGVPDRLR